MAIRTMGCLTFASTTGALVGITAVRGTEVAVGAAAGAAVGVAAGAAVGAAAAGAVVGAATTGAAVGAAAAGAVVGAAKADAAVAAGATVAAGAAASGVAVASPPQATTNARIAATSHSGLNIHRLDHDENFIISSCYTIRNILGIGTTVGY